MKIYSCHYSYTVIWDAEKNMHRGTVAEFPLLSAFAYSPEGALREIRGVIASCLKDMQKKREPLPKPGSPPPMDLQRNINEALKELLPLQRVLDSKAVDNAVFCLRRGSL